MNGLLASFIPLWKRLRKHKIELLLLGLASVITLVTLILFISETKSNSESNKEMTDEIITPFPAINTKIVVDLAGAVEKPGLYEASKGARLHDILLLAGGLSGDAQQDYFARNFNLAKLVSDQEKIYIPSLSEINNGMFTESAQSSEYRIPSISYAASDSNAKININTASSDELDTLPGVGKITADKIIKGRRYSLIEELLTKKIINKTVYQNIKDLISI